MCIALTAARRHCAPKRCACSPRLCEQNGIARAPFYGEHIETFANSSLRTDVHGMSHPNARMFLPPTWLGWDHFTFRMFENMAKLILGCAVPWFTIIILCGEIFEAFMKETVGLRRPPEYLLAVAYFIHSWYTNHQCIWTVKCCRVTKDLVVGLFPKFERPIHYRNDALSSWACS